MTFIILLLFIFCGNFAFIGKCDIAIPLGITGAALSFAVWMDS